MSTTQRQRSPFPPPFWAAVGLAVAVSWLRTFVPALRTELWGWILLAVQAIVLVIVIAYFVRFLRGQRDDYWRERGKDPKHPED
jgi:hypothetical protein